MSARRLLTGVAVVSAVVIGLTGCQKHSTRGSSSNHVQAPAASTTPPAPVEKTTGSPTPSASSSSDDPDGAGSCTTPAPKAGRKYVQAVKPPKQDTLYVKDAKFVCDPNDGHYAGAGAEKTYGFAAKVTAQIANGPGKFKTVPVGELWTHIGDCLLGEPVKDPASCSGGIYEIALDGTGKITEIKEIWHA
ncbi:hypothetical protein F4556_003494 [Kitasatospora gansuensis]|uniref:Lipoprotein n=1 Tax=Kitasatospora gansuensis TaxID=258050 RepID=A0A7W7SCJ1_9ACTN|nr:hypothetical protein [Kitasatospora gansuensis]MBB4947959.1 hypothetical protein [Kitasatospora gansuensis]